MAGLILRESSLHLLIALIKAWRKYRSTDLGFVTTGSEIEKAANAEERVRLLEQRTDIAVLLMRLAEYDFAKVVDGTRMGALRTDPGTINAILKQQKRSDKHRVALQNRLQRSRKLARICGEFGQGLIPLITKDISSSIIHKMSEDSICNFHSLLKRRRLFVMELCKIGNSIRSVFENDAVIA